MPIDVAPSLQELIDTLPFAGKVVWIGIRPERDATMQPLDHVDATTAYGLAGDRYAGGSGKRQVTLIQAEHLPVIASYLKRTAVTPDALRRNLVVNGINLLALKNRIIRVGSVELEVTGLCHPCSKMERILGSGGYNAMRGHGGVTARVLSDGVISIGDSVADSPINH